MRTHIPNPFQSITGFVLLACLAAGCNQPSNGPGQSAAPRDASVAVRIDPAENGAAVKIKHRQSRENPVSPRDLAFVMAGTAPVDQSADAPDARAASTQAAIVDALYRAVADDRRAAGRSMHDFTEPLSPRLTLTHASASAGEDIRVRLVSVGAEIIFEVRDGRLTHPPHDLEAVHKLFEATLGRFALLETRVDPESETCVARVGCYEPAGRQTTYAGEPDRREASDTP